LGISTRYATAEMAVIIDTAVNDSLRFFDIGSSL
jgi:hypothetical protein